MAEQTDDVRRRAIPRPNPDHFRRRPVKDANQPRASPLISLDSRRAQADVRGANLPAFDQGAGHERLLRLPQGQHPLWLSLFRPDPTQRPHPTVFSSPSAWSASSAATGRSIRSAAMCCVGAAEQFHGWVREHADQWDAPILEAPKGRRDEFVEPYSRGAQPDQIVVILKAREPAPSGCSFRRDGSARYAPLLTRACRSSIRRSRSRP
jgi:hypothetical protein